MKHNIWLVIKLTNTNHDDKKLMNRPVLSSWMAIKPKGDCGINTVVIFVQQMGMIIFSDTYIQKICFPTML